MIDLFFKGGLLMIPLLTGSIIMLTIIIERSCAFSGTGIKSGFINTIKEQYMSCNAALPESVDRQKKGPVQRLVFDILEMREQSAESIEKNASLKGDEYLHNLEKHLHLLELIGRTAPMLGLLGTVMGMVEAFRQVASVKTVVDPTILAGGIWEALITTVFGLIVGIPALIAHHLFTEKLERVAFQMKIHSEEIISFIKGTHG